MSNMLRSSALLFGNVMQYRCVSNAGITNACNITITITISRSKIAAPGNQALSLGAEKWEDSKGVGNEKNIVTKINFLVLLLRLVVF
jgi:hypothetical protein